MIIAKRLKGKAIATWLGPTGEAARRALTRARQRITNAPGRLDFYVDIADPMSYLTAQVVARLVAIPEISARVELAVHVVTPPASDVDPAPEQRTKHAVRDAREAAQYWNVEFPAQKEADSGMVRDVGTSLIRDRSGADQLQAVLELTGAMWAGDRKRLGSLLLKYGAESSTSIPPVLNAAYAELRKAGHYQGATIHYAGVWYAGIDRVAYLEAALAAERGTSVAPVPPVPPVPPILAVRPEAERGRLALSDKPLSCELWFGFGSPDSYLTLEQIEDVLAPHGVPLVLKPVGATANRGIAVPDVKKMYVLHDAKREADRTGLAFGELCEPTAKGIDHCLAIAHWAQQRGGTPQLLAFARSALRGIWSEAMDVSEYVDLKQIVERAGLPWADAQAALAAPEAAKAAQANATELAVFSLWDVPSFRCGELIATGHDRLPLLADRLRRHSISLA